MFVQEAQDGVSPAVGIRDSATPQSMSGAGRGSADSRASAGSRGPTPVAMGHAQPSGGSDGDDEYGDDDFEVRQCWT